MRSPRSAASRASTWCGRLHQRRDFRSCAMCVPAGSARRRARWPPARPTFSVSRWMRTTALTKPSPARSATISASRPKRSAPQRASLISSFRSRSSWTQPFSDNLKAPRFETGKAVARRRHRRTLSTAKAAPPFPASGSAFISLSTTFPQGSARWPMASAATPTIPGISTTSPASRSPTFPTCRANSPTCGYPGRNTRCSPTPSTSRPFAAPSTRSGITGCRHRG